MTTNAAPPGGARKVGYFAQWGIYARNFKVKNIDTSGMASKLTHINYAFGNVSEQGRCFEANQAGVGDAWADYQTQQYMVLLPFLHFFFSSSWVR